MALIDKLAGIANITRKITGFTDKLTLDEITTKLTTYEEEHRLAEITISVTGGATATVYYWNNEEFITMNITNSNVITVPKNSMFYVVSETPYQGTMGGTGQVIKYSLAASYSNVEIKDLFLTYYSSTSSTSRKIKKTMLCVPAEDKGSIQIRRTSIIMNSSETLQNTEELVQE